jgi:hypothetical protein
VLICVSYQRDVIRRFVKAFTPIGRVVVPQSRQLDLFSQIHGGMLGVPDGVA